MTTLRNLYTGSLRLINAVSANEEPSAADMDITQTAFTGLLDSMQADLLNIFTINPYRFPLVAGQQEYTLGPGSINNQLSDADWVLPRPMRVERAVLLQAANIAYPEEPLPPPTEPTVALRVGSAVEFDAEYSAYVGSTVTPHSETGWDEVNVNSAAEPTFNGDVLDWGNYDETNAVRITSPFPGSGYSCVEFVVNVLPPSNYLTVGTWEEGFGPSWNPNSGEPTVPCLWVSDGRTITYGGTNSGGPTFTDGDVIGVVRNVSGAQLLFFKNGVYALTLSTNASTQWPIVSLVGLPS